MLADVPLDAAAVTVPDPQRDVCVNTRAVSRAIPAEERLQRTVFGAPARSAHARPVRCLAGALAAITAAVVGVIANLSLWFAAHVLFAQITTTTYGHLHLLTPDLGTLKPLATALALLAAVLLLKRHWPLPWVLAICAGVSAAVAAF